VPGGPFKLKCYQPTQTMVTAGIIHFRENFHGRAGNRTRDLMISCQILRPLDQRLILDVRQEHDFLLLCYDNLWSLVRLLEQREMLKFGVTLCEYGICQFIDKLSLTPVITVSGSDVPNLSPPRPPGRFGNRMT